MKTLAIDIETYSSVSLQKAGVYAYAASPDFEILLFGYAWDDGPVEVIDMAQGQKLLLHLIVAASSIRNGAPLRSMPLPTPKVITSFGRRLPGLTL